MSQPLTANRTQTFLLPPSIEEWVEPEDPVRFVAAYVETLDLPALGMRASERHAPGAPAYDPALLLSVWLYGAMRRVRSTRQLEIACRERLPFRWLTGNLTPDHNAFWRFLDAHRSLFRRLFRQLVQLAARQGLVAMVVHALDGTKLTAACSTRTALHKKGLLDALAKVGDAAIEQVLDEVDAAHRTETHEPSPRLPAALVDRDARRAAIRADLAKLAAAGTEHLHPQEPEARIMKSSAGSVLGYNAQAVVDDAGLLVAQDVGAGANDADQLGPMLDQVEATLGEVADHTLADTGYESSEQLARAKAANREIVGATKPSQLEAPADQPYDKAHFAYDAERDVMVCPRGPTLSFEGIKREKRRLPVLVYRCQQTDCPVRGACTKDPKGRTVRRTEADPALLAQREKMRDPAQQALYRMRKQMIELVFARIKAIEGFRRFTVRGLIKVRAQWSLVCLAYNLNLLARAWRAGALRLAT